jgi:hypothetical protein
MQTQMSIITLPLTLLLTIYAVTNCMAIAPYVTGNDTDCCDDTNTVYMPDISGMLNDEPVQNQTIDNFENLLVIPFSERDIRDFGIHKYVMSRNIKTLMTYHSDSHLINIIIKSMNQSSNEIVRLVNKNRDEFDVLAKDEFAANFLDFWCAYRIIQLSEFMKNNLDVLANMFKDIVNTPPVF